MSNQSSTAASLPEALLVIDVQVAMTRPEDPTEAIPYKRDEMLSNIQLLLNSARSSGAPVIYVQHNDVMYPPMAEGAPGFAVDPDVAPLAGDTIFVKTACDSFAQTDLEQHLRDHGISHIVTCGMQSDYCVDTGSRSALGRGFNVTLATDAHSTWDNEAFTAEQIITYVNNLLPGLPGPGTRITAKTSAEIQFARVD